MLKKECGVSKKVDNNYWYYDQDQEGIWPRPATLLAIYQTKMTLNDLKNNIFNVESHKNIVFNNYLFLKKKFFFTFLGHVHFKKFLIISEISQKSISMGSSPVQKLYLYIKIIFFKNYFQNTNSPNLKKKNLKFFFSLVCFFLLEWPRTNII